MEAIYNQPQPDRAKVEKLITFNVADYCLALPIGEVLQVVQFPVSNHPELSRMGLVQLGRHTIRMVDLHQQLGLDLGICKQIMSQFVGCVRR